MRMREPVKCLVGDCANLTRSSTKKCPTHRPDLPVVRNGKGVSVLGHQLTVEQAYSVASRIADALGGKR